MMRQPSRWVTPWVHARFTIRRAFWWECYREAAQVGRGANEGEVTFPGRGPYHLFPKRI